MKYKVLSAFMALILGLTPIHSANAIFGFGDIVFDPTNYGRNLLTAARTLQQVNNQIRQLRNEAQMLLNQSQNLTRLPMSIGGDLQRSLLQMDVLIRSANGLAYQITAIDAHYRTYFPERYAAATTSTRILQDGQDAWKAARSGFQHSLHVQAEVMGQVRSDRIVLDRLIMESQGAAGNLQVAQAGNQLTALAAKQTMQLQSLIAASARADALEKARVLALTEQARARFQHFLGDASAYTP
ncbi:P-type conjugative transfer protein TrbJ [Candidatus Wolfebacteria bacterium]|nr:MAG: P-type conjugative transfer protein TrbJ [Candidatus Wolfebacteria bacterium]